MTGASKPKYSAEASRAVAEHRQRYHLALRAVAEHVAALEDHETVQSSHVARAHHILVGDHDALHPFYRRREFLTGCGAFVGSLSLGVAGFSLNFSYRDGQILEGAVATFWIWVVALPVLLFIAGACLAMFGWMKD